MKNILFTILMTIFCLSACKNGADKKNNSVAKETVNIEQIEKESEDLEQTAKEIELKEAALEAALKELE